MQSANFPVSNCIYHVEYQKKDTIFWIWEKTKLNLKEKKTLEVQTYLWPMVYIMQNATWDSVPSTATAYLTRVCQIIIII